MEDREKLVPKDNQQEQWERNGRMYAAMDYIKTEKFADPEIIYVILGGDKKDLAWKKE